MEDEDYQDSFFNVGFGNHNFEINFDEIIESYLNKHDDYQNFDLKNGLIMTRDDDDDSNCQNHQHHQPIKQTTYEQAQHPHQKRTVMNIERKQFLNVPPVEQQKNSETSNLNKFFHREITRFLKKLDTCKMLTEEQRALTKEYENSKFSRNSIKTLMMHEKIKKGVYEHFNSSSLVEEIFKSKKMNFPTKIKTLNYLNKFLNLLKTDVREDPQK